MRKKIKRVVESLTENDLDQARVFSKLFFNDSDPDLETLGQATWLYSDLIKSFSLAVQNGIANAFKSNT